LRRAELLLAAAFGRKRADRERGGALVVRGGVVALPDPGPAVLWSPQLSVGIAVY
jgi:hypothetical protein